MQCLEVSGAVRPIYVSLGVKRLTDIRKIQSVPRWKHNPSRIYKNQSGKAAQSRMYKNQSANAAP
jgi:hypothetical protein